MTVPVTRLAGLNDRPTRPSGEFVLYWMVAARRLRWNYALERAVSLAREFRVPLVIFEPLRAGYPWASDRFHTFVMEGMREKAARLDGSPVRYFPYVEPAPGDGNGLLETMAGSAVAVVTDWYPCFFIPRMTRAAGQRLAVRLEHVDSNGILPLAVTDEAFKTAYAFRRFLQKTLPDHLLEHPTPDPLAGEDLPRLDALPAEVTDRWHGATLSNIAAHISTLPIAHDVAPTDLVGGEEAAHERLERFLEAGLPRYAEERNALVDEPTSRLSPYLHFGHLSTHEVVHALFAHAGWTPDRLSPTAKGQRQGWWNLDPNAEAFLDQIITWRELGFNMCQHRADYASFDSLPEWARRTLAEHEADPRPHQYDPETMDAAGTHDEIWNAAQRQLRREGRIHNYLRMLWGKKILEWSPSPRQALDTMIELNNRYALDGRDPNSYSGIFWTLGRYDRPWGPERPIFGTIRYMSSENTARKLSLKPYLAAFGPESQPELWDSGGDG